MNSSFFSLFAFLSYCVHSLNQFDITYAYHADYYIHEKDPAINRKHTGDEYDAAKKFLEL